MSSENGNHLVLYCDGNNVRIMNFKSIIHFFFQYHATSRGLNYNLDFFLSYSTDVIDWQMSDFLEIANENVAPSLDIADWR